MYVEFKLCDTDREIRALRAFDKKVFREADLFTVREWRDYVSYWMVIDNAIVGCCGFLHDTDFTEDIRQDGKNEPLKGSLYISTSGILPRFQGKGLGQLLKSWEVAYARYHSCSRVITNTRKKNLPIISLNRKFGFRVVRTTPRYYSQPTDATVVMELRLTNRG